MLDKLDFQTIQQNLAEAKNILILLPANPALDSVAAGLSLYLSFKKQGKNVGVGCSTQMTVAFNRLIGVNKITNKIGSRNLIVSFDYLKDSIEKVSYNIEDNKFNLVIEPKPNFPPLDSSKVSYSYTGANADIIFIVGATKLEDLQNLYFEEKNIFTNKLTVNIDNKRQNTRFGQINLHDSQVASCSEIVVELIKALDLSLDQDITTNLYAGIKANTSNFQSVNIAASTFEAAAWCLKNGAVKEQTIPMEKNQFQPSFQPTTQPILNKVSPSPPFSQPINQPDVPASSLSQQAVSAENKEVRPPPDWFKPKIFRGNTQV